MTEGSLGPHYGALPDDVVRSPTGRVPIWVMDEALGHEASERVAFRGPTTAAVLSQRRPQGSTARRRVKITAGVLLFTGLVVLTQSGAN